MKKRKRLYNKYGRLNKRGIKLSDKVKKVISKLIDDNPDYDLMDMERGIVYEARYICTMQIARERYRKEKND